MKTKSTLHILGIVISLALFSPLQANAAAGSFLADTIDLSPGADVFGPDHFVLNRSNHKLYVIGHAADQGNGKQGIKVIDTLSQSVIGGIDLGSYTFGSAGNQSPPSDPRAITVDDSPAPDGNKLYAVLSVGYSFETTEYVLRTIDSATNTSLTAQGTDLVLPLSSVADDNMAVNPTTHELYISDHDGTNIVVINGPSRALFSIPVNIGSGPHSYAVNPVANKVFAFGPKGGVIIDGASGTATPLSLSLSINDAVFDSANGHVYCIGDESNATVSHLLVLDGTNGAILMSKEVVNDAFGSSALGVDPTANTIYLGLANTNSTVALNASDLSTKATFHPGAQRLLFDPASSRIFLVDTGQLVLGNAVGILNPVTGDFTHITTGYQPAALAINSKTRLAYIADAAASEMIVFDTVADTVVARVPLTEPRHRIAVSSTLNRIYLTSLDQTDVNNIISRLDVFDGTNNQFLQSVVLPSDDGRGVVATDDTRHRVYVSGSQSSNQFQNVLHIIDQNTNALITTINLPEPVGEIAVNPVTGRVYIDGGVLGPGENVVIIDGNTNQIVTTVSAGSVPGPIAINTKTNKVYVANVGSGSVDNTVTVINGATDSFEKTFSNTNSNNGDAVTSVAVDEASNTIYLGDDSDQTEIDGRVTIFSGASNAFLGQIGVGRYPGPLAFDLATRNLFAGNNQDGTVSVIQNGNRPPPPPPPHGGLGATLFTVNNSTDPSNNVTDTALSFAAQQGGTPAGVIVRVQASTTPNDETSWSQLPDGTDGFMTQDLVGQQFVLSSTNYPLQNGVYFRAISSAPGYPDSISNKIGPFNLATGGNHLGPTLLYITKNGPVANIRFGVTETTIPDGITVRIQITDTPGSEASWMDAPVGSSGHLIQDLQDNPTQPNQFYLGSDDYPSGESVYFRAVASAPGNVDSISSVFGPYTFILDPAATVSIGLSNGLVTDAHGGEDFDFPLTVHAGSFDVTATAQSGRQITYLALKYDGDTLKSFTGVGDQGDTLQYNAGIPGDHLIEAIAADDLGVIGDARPVHIRVAPAAPGRMLFARQAGNWSDPSIWVDADGNSGVPGPDDFAVLSDQNVSLPSDVNVNAVSLHGGTISGPGTLNVTGFLTIGGGNLSANVNIASGAVAELINDVDIGISGHVVVSGIWKMHGKGGITGITNAPGALAMTMTGNRSVNPDGLFDGIVGFLQNLGNMIFHRPAGGRAGSGSAPPPPANSPPAREVRQIALAGMGNSGEVSADKLITQDGGSLVASGGGNLVGNSGGTLINQDGGSLVASGGGNLVASGGGNLVASGGGNLVASGGGNLVATGGGNLVASGGGNFNLTSGSGATSSKMHAATAPAVYTQTGGNTDLDFIRITGPVVLNGGVLTGSGIIEGDLTNNSGYVSPGLLAVTGSYIQASGGTLILRAAGGEANQFDQLQIGDVADLNGKLDLKTINGYTPDPADTFNPIGYSSVSGSFASVSSNTQVTANATGLITSVNPAAPNPSSGQPLNIATRMSVQTGDNVLIAGFIVNGPSGSTKKVLIRGMGPSLSQFGVSGTLPDPFLELHKPDGSMVSNDNWQEGDTSQIPNGFAPSDPREAVIVATLTPGNYSAVVKGAHGETGVGIAELYDLDSASPAKLANISTRGFINTGDDVMIGGFIVGGTEPAKILVRAIGPTLTDFGVQGALADPTLELHDSNGTTISNDDWRETQESEIIATTIPPNKDREPAILATLVPGNYTAVVRGKNNTTGVGLVEAYNLQ